MSTARIIGTGLDLPRGQGVTLTMTADLTLTGGATASSYTWSQVSGVFIALTGTGNARSFVTPIVRQLTNLVFRVVVAFSDGTSSTAQYTVAVLPVTEWLATAQGEVPLTWQSASSTALPAAPTTTASA